MRPAHEGLIGFSFDEADEGAVVSILFEAGLESRRHRRRKGRFTVQIYEKYKEVLGQKLYDRGISFTTYPVGLLPFVKRTARRHAAFCVGCLLGVLLLCGSRAFIWEVRFVGTVPTDRDALLCGLEEAGLSEGMPVFGFDGDAIAASFLQRHEEISWITVRRTGVVAEVELRPRTGSPITAVPEDGNGYVNLVSDCDAVITEITVRQGRAAVKVGDTVRAGELLISGLMDTYDGVRGVTADGEVYGMMERTFEVFVPESETVTERTDGRLCGFSFSLFGLQIGRLPADAEVQTRRLYLFDRFRLPITVSTAYRYTEEQVEVHYTAGENARLAHSRLSDELRYFLREGELLEKEVTGAFEEGGYRIRCRIVFIGKIAKPLAFYMENQ